MLKVAGEEVGPALLLLLGDLGKAVAGEVDKADAVDVKEVDVRGLARGARDLDQTLAVEELVEQGGLAHVGAAGNGDLGRGRGGKLRHGAVRGLEARGLVVDAGHAGPFGLNR